MRFTDGVNIVINFDKEVIDLFEQHKQLAKNTPESGGQIFAHHSKGEVFVSRATGLRDGDRRERFLFWPNRRQERKEIKKMYSEGYHYIGDWHTHPEEIPTPSLVDIKNILECFQKSKHDLKFFVMVIVGTANFPDGIHVSINNHECQKKIPYIVE